jgi:DNA-binding response OmpR family regulator
MPETTTGVVLLVSPHGTSADSLAYEQLSAARVGVRRVCDVASAMRWLRGECADVLVLAPDGATSGDGGPDVLARVRRNGFAGMILVIGRTADRSAAVAALDRGADDYVALSRDPSELVARVRALGRRGTVPPVLEREIDGVVLDLRHGVVRGDGVEVVLTRREADLFEYLARNTGHPVSREELATRIWRVTPPSGGGTNIVDVYVSYLRRKLAVIGRQSLIRSVRGVGYELVERRDAMTRV